MSNLKKGRSQFCFSATYRPQLLVLKELEPFPWGSSSSVFEFLCFYCLSILLTMKHFHYLSFRVWPAIR